MSPRRAPVLALLLHALLAGLLLTAPSPATAAEQAPVIDGPGTRFSAVGSGVVVSGSATPNEPVFVGVDPRGPQGPRLLTAMYADAAGRWSATVPLDTDYRVFVASAGQLSESVLLFGSPTIEGPRITEQLRPAPARIGGRGAPGSSVLVSYRRAGDPAGVYPITQVLPVGQDGMWGRELSSTTSWQFHVRRTNGAPRSLDYLVQSRFGPALSALQRDLQAALGMTRWPADMRPTITPGVFTPFLSDEITRCVGIGPVPATGCAWGPVDAPRTAVIVGDSVATTWIEPVRAVLARQGGWRVVNYSATGCPFTAVHTNSFAPHVTAGCPAKKEEAVAAIQALKPDLLIVSNLYGFRQVVGTTDFLGYAEWLQSTGDILRRVAPSSGRIVLLSGLMANRNLLECYRPQGSPVDCLVGVPANWQEIAAAERVLATAFNGTWVDTRMLFCTPHNRCPAVVGNLAVTPDIMHISRDYGLRIVPQLTEILQAYDLL